MSFILHIMKHKIEKNFLYEGLGFPIELHNVEMIYLDDAWHPKINVREIAKKAIIALITQPERLSGNHVRFIRNYFSMSLREFAEIMHVSHTAVNKWEKHGHEFSNMDMNAENMLRLYIHDKVIIKDSKKQQKEFYEIYSLIVALPSAHNDEEHSENTSRYLQINGST